MGRIDDLLESARARLARLTPEEAHDAQAGGGVILDTRTYEQRHAYGVIPGAIVMSRNVVEWRVDPTSGWDDPDVVSRTGPVIVMCQEGYASSLAAATLVDLGIDDATDMIGGFEAWKAAGLPTEPAPPPGSPHPS
jgi:rhodanese-related sulfurtransferase